MSKTMSDKQRKLCDALSIRKDYKVQYQIKRNFKQLLKSNDTAPRLVKIVFGENQDDVSRFYFALPSDLTKIIICIAIPSMKISRKSYDVLTFNKETLNQNDIRLAGFDNLITTAISGRIQHFSSQLTLAINHSNKVMKLYAIVNSSKRSTEYYQSNYHEISYFANDTEISPTIDNSLFERIYVD